MDTPRRTVLTAALGGIAASALGLSAEAAGLRLAQVPTGPKLIARIWHGHTPAAKTEEYTKYLYEAGIKKIIPDDKTLREAWIRFERGTQLHVQFEQLKAEFDKQKPPKPPADLKVRIEAVLDDNPELPWYDAIYKILGEDLDEIYSDDKEKDVELNFDDEGDDDQV